MSSLRPFLAALVALAALGSPLTAGTADAAGCTVLDGRADLACTPGAFNPDVSPSTLASTICRSGWTATIRPPSRYTTTLKDQQKIGYGEVGLPDTALEEDHLVPLELGGSPRDPANLWPQPRRAVAPAGRAAEDKDAEENTLKAQVCGGQLGLAGARQRIIADWTH